MINDQQPCCSQASSDLEILLIFEQEVKPLFLIITLGGHPITTWTVEGGGRLFNWSFYYISLIYKCQSDHEGEKGVKTPKNITTWFMDVSLLGSSIQIHRTKAALGLTLSKIQQKYFDPPFL